MTMEDKLSMLDKQIEAYRQEFSRILYVGLTSGQPMEPQYTECKTKWIELMRQRDMLRQRII